MSSPDPRSHWGREELLHLLSACGTLAGLSITIIAFMHGFDRARTAVTVVDDMLALCAALFLAALTTMTIAAFVTIYTIW